MLSFFKKLFNSPSQEQGKNNTHKATVGTKTTTTTTKTTITSIDWGDRRIYPFLARADWEGHIHNNQVSVFHYTKEEQPLVYRTIVMEDNGGLGALNTSEMAPEYLEKVMEDAEAHLSELDFTFKPMEISKGKVLVSQGHEYVTEMILLNDKMKAVQDHLKANKLYVSIAKRGVILICDEACDKETWKIFLGAHLTIWDTEDEVQRISKDIFIVKDGNIEGVTFLE